MPPTTAPAPLPVERAAPAADGQSRTARVPILMYHYISDPGAGAGAVRRDLSVTPDRFETHLRYLKEHGYQTITLDDLQANLSQGKSLPPKPVILTFDDGYVDNYREAFPLLAKYGMAGHFFIITDRPNEAHPDYMSWGQLAEMQAAGQQIEAHTRNHPDLRGRSVEFLQYQALGNIESMQLHLGRRPHWIAYPSGKYDARTAAVFRSAGFWGGLTTAFGDSHTLDGIFTLSRVRVRGSTTASDLGRLLGNP